MTAHEFINNLKSVLGFCVLAYGLLLLVQWAVKHI